MPKIIVELPSVYKVLICGDRNWTDEKPIEEEIHRLLIEHGKKLVIIAGGAKGADQIAEEYAKHWGIHVARVEAIWDFYHKAAGPCRNTAMLMLHPDEIIAFHQNIKKSKGTKDMVEKAKYHGVPFKVVAGRKLLQNKDI